MRAPFGHVEVYVTPNRDVKLAVYLSLEDIHEFVGFLFVVVF